MKRWNLVAIIVLLSGLVGCSMYYNDRQYVWDSEYQKACDLYDNCGSIDVVVEVLHDHKWTPGQINEVCYRLSQDYSFDENGVPRGIERPRPVVQTRRPAALGVGERPEEER